MAFITYKKSLKAGLASLSIIALVSCGSEIRDTELLNEAPSILAPPAPGSSTATPTASPTASVGGNELNCTEPRHINCSHTPNPNQPIVPLAGEFLTTDGQKIDLDKVKDKPTIILFAQETCSVCIEEHLEIQTLIEENGLTLENVNLYTVLVGAYPEDAEYWAEGYNFPWPVGYDQNLELFSKYFRLGSTVPTAIVGTPSQGLVYSHIGKTSKTELEKYTGKWR